MVPVLQKSMGKRFSVNTLLMNLWAQSLIWGHTEKTLNAFCTFLLFYFILDYPEYACWQATCVSLASKDEGFTVTLSHPGSKRVASR